MSGPEILSAAVRMWLDNDRVAAWRRKNAGKLAASRREYCQTVSDQTVLEFGQSGAPAFLIHVGLLNDYAGAMDDRELKLGSPYKQAALIRAGKPVFHLQDPKWYVAQVKDLLYTSGAQLPNLVGGELTIDPERSDDEHLTEEQQIQMSIACDVRELVQEMLDNCPWHLLYGMADEDVIFMSKLPSMFSGLELASEPLFSLE
jgi:hypothetical protein